MELFFVRRLGFDPCPRGAGVAMRGRLEVEGGLRREGPYTRS